MARILSKREGSTSRALQARGVLPMFADDTAERIERERLSIQRWAIAWAALPPKSIGPAELVQLLRDLGHWTPHPGFYRPHGSGVAEQIPIPVTVGAETTCDNCSGPIADGDRGYLCDCSDGSTVLLCDRVCDPR